jgi:enoyl-CoA hydratase/carnithine racemase
MSQDYEDILFEVSEKIATITLNRPERMNALTPSMQAELHNAFDRADKDADVKVIILTGAGSAFCAGFNQGRKVAGGVRPSDPHGKSHAEFLKYWYDTDSSRVTQWTHMWSLGKPIIAAVNGWAMGAGFWYQLAADITIASEKAVFAQPEVRHISNSSFLFTALCGWKAANRWTLTGDHFDAHEALRIGMINEVIAANRFQEHVRALAKRMTLVPEPSLRLNKAIAMKGMLAAGVNAGLLVEGALGALVHGSHNEEREELFKIQHEKGLRAFLEARDGPFQPEPMGPRSRKPPSA